MLFYLSSVIKCFLSNLFKKKKKKVTYQSAPTASFSRLQKRYMFNVRRVCVSSAHLSPASVYRVSRRSGGVSYLFLLRLYRVLLKQSRNAKREKLHVNWAEAKAPILPPAWNTVSPLNPLFSKIFLRQLLEKASLRLYGEKPSARKAINSSCCLLT